MKLLYCGNGTRGVACLTKLLELSHDLVGVIVNHKGADPESPNTVAEIANKAGIPVFDPRNINGDHSIRDIENLQPNLMIMSGYNQILKRPVLDLLPRKIINLHGGKLPAYRGGSPINWQIINGETTGGCAIIFANEGIDTGDIILQRTYEISPNETAGDVTARVNQIFPEMLTQVLDNIEKDCITAKSQNLSEGAYYCKRHAEDGWIDLTNLSDVDVHNMIRALNGPSLPGAFCYLGQEKITLRRSALLSETIIGTAGRIWKKWEDGVVVLCKNRGLLIQDVQVGDNKQLLPAETLLTGQRVQLTSRPV